MPFTSSVRKTFGPFGKGPAPFSEPDIVKSNLVAYYDAANPNSYPGSGNTWFDLSENNLDATLTNSPTWNFENNNASSFLFQRSLLQNADCNNNMLSFIGTGDVSYTLQSWIKINSYANGAGVDGFGIVGSGSTYGLGYQVFGNGLSSYVNIGYRGTSNVDGNIVLSIGSWYHVVFSREAGVNNYLYINGVLDRTYDPTNLSINDTTGNPITNIFIGGNNDRIGYMDGYISFVTIHNSFLTQSQVTQNFNATRSRYGV